MLWKCFTQYASKFGKLSSGHRTRKGQFSFQSQRKAMSLGLPSKVMLKSSKVMLKILQARLQQYMNCELPDVQAGFRKGRGARNKLPTSVGSSKKQESSRKTSTSALLTMPKPLTVWTDRHLVKTVSDQKFFKIQRIHSLTQNAADRLMFPNL